MSVDFVALQQTGINRIKSNTSNILGRFGFLSYVKPVIQPVNMHTTQLGAPVHTNMWTSGNAGAPTAMDIDSMLSAVTPVPFEVLKQIELGDASTYPEEVTGAVDELLMGYYSTLEELWGTAVIGAGAFTHPANAKSFLDANPTGTAYYVDDITIDPVDGGTPFNTTNKYAATLGSSTLEAMIAARMNARDFSGDRAPRPTGKGLLASNTSLGMQGESQLARTNEGLDGAGAQLLAGFGDRLQGPVHLDSKVTGAAVVWGAMWSRPATIYGAQYDLFPIHPVIKAGMMIRVMESPDKNFINVIGYGKLGILYSPYQYDLQLSIA